LPESTVISRIACVHCQKSQDASLSRLAIALGALPPSGNGESVIGINAPVLALMEKTEMSFDALPT
jgi:hypothetical protein